MKDKYTIEAEKEENITVGESALKVVVGKKKDKDIEFCLRVKEWCKRNNVKYVGDYLVAPVFQNMISEILDKTLSTPLPPVEDCVVIDMEKMVELMKKTQHAYATHPTRPILYGEDFREVAKAIANSKSILKWKKGE